MPPKRRKPPDEAALQARKLRKAELERARRARLGDAGRKTDAAAKRRRRAQQSDEQRKAHAEAMRRHRAQRSDEQRRARAEAVRLQRAQQRAAAEQKRREEAATRELVELQGQWTQAVGGAQHHVAKALPHMSSVVRQVCAEDPAVDAHPVRLKQEITEEPCQSTSQAVYQEFVEEPDVDISHLVKQELIEESDMNTGNVAKQEFTEEVDMDISQVVKKELLEEPHLDFTHSVKQECIEDSEEVITGLPYDECELSSVKSHTSPGLPVEPAYNVRPQSTVFPSSLHWSHGVQISPALVARP